MESWKLRIEFGIVKFAFGMKILNLNIGFCLILGISYKTSFFFFLIENDDFLILQASNL